MTFDTIVGNPPYNTEHVNDRPSGNVIWDDFVRTSLKHLHDGGFLCFVHPSLWRKPENEYSNVRLYELMTRYHMSYLSIHDVEDGKRTFGAGTRYDWYVLQKIFRHGCSTIRDEHGNTHSIDIGEWPFFIPNSSYDLIKPLLITDPSDASCEVIFDSSYHAVRPHVSETRDPDEYPHPLIHSTNKNGTRIFYSSRNDKGHFETPKVIFGESGINDVVVDEEGKYGITEFAYAIADEPENLPKIKEALESERFLEIMNACKRLGHTYDRKVIELLRKDFWKEFIDEE